MLTNEQIEQLFDFCRRHSVTYYDVQVELVDHLANAIEDKMAAQPTLGFEAALQQVYKSFGRTGFAPVVREKQKAAHSYNRKLMWRLFKQQLGWPKIFLAATIFTIMYVLMQWENKMPVRLVVILGVVTMTIIMMVTVYRLRNWQKRTGKKFLLVNMAGMGNLVFLPINCLNIINPFISGKSNFLNHSMFGNTMLCIGFTLYFLLAIVSCQAVTHVQKLLATTYPGLDRPGIA